MRSHVAGPCKPSRWGLTASAVAREVVVAVSGRQV